jgi:hypothetical protein
MNLTLTCELCGYVTISRESLRIHKRRAHTSERYPCPDCQFKAKRKSCSISCLTGEIKKIKQFFFTQTWFADSFVFHVCCIDFNRISVWRDNGKKTSV